MHFEYDKHQYFFEKFLRKEMHGEELDSFKAKLSENEKFKKDFDFYLANRKKIIKEGLAEYDEAEILLPKPQKWGWFYAISSVLCLVLIIDYFLSSSYDQSIAASHRRKPLIERINFFKSGDAQTELKETEKIQKEIRPEKSSMKNLDNENSLIDSAELFSETEKQLQSYIQSNTTGIQSDFILMDSLMWVFDQRIMEERRASLNMQTDSILDDSSIQMLVFKSLYRKNNVSQKQLFVEYWKSPIHFRGYRFSGKKLLLFGFETSDPLYFTYDEEGANFHLFLLNKEFYLFPDNQFHKILKD